jgi:hypothetical protein
MWAPGTQVECIDDQNWNWPFEIPIELFSPLPKKGSIYVVDHMELRLPISGTCSRGINCRFCNGVRIVGFMLNFAACRFRPVDRTNREIERLRELIKKPINDPIKERELVNVDD